MYELATNTINYYSHWLSYLALGSIIFLLLSIILIPKWIARIPHDYFTYRKRKSFSESSGIRQVFISIAKNLTGLVLVFSGAIMLLLPGQGLLTMFVGLLLLNFPGKYRLERALIKNPTILAGLNWIRRKQNVTELVI